MNCGEEVDRTKGDKERKINHQEIMVLDKMTHEQNKNQGSEKENKVYPYL
jgi:hypothetical protein